MKILGVNNKRFEPVSYIVEISASEISKILNDVFTSKYKEFVTGDIVDLSVGYNFKQDIMKVCNSMNEAYKSFEKASDTVFEFTKLIGENSNEEA